MSPPIDTCTMKVEVPFGDQQIEAVLTLPGASVEKHALEHGRLYSTEAWREAARLPGLSGATSIPQQPELLRRPPLAASGIRGFFRVIDVENPTIAFEVTAQSELPEYRKRQLAAVDLLNGWLADDSGYDERTWPELKKAIERDRTSYRRRFSG